MDGCVATPHSYVPVSSSIPHAEVWTPSRPMLNNTLPIPATDSDSLRRLLMTARKRRETSAMRQIWRTRKSQGHSVSTHSVLGQYKHMLSARDGGTRGCFQDETSAPVQRTNQQLLLNNRQTTANSQNRKAELKGGAVKLAEAESVRKLEMPSHAKNGNIRRCVGLPNKTAAFQRANTDHIVENSQKSRSSPGKINISSYNVDYIAKIGMSSAPKIPIRTLSADWWSEIQKKPTSSRLSYSEPVVVQTDREKIRRQLAGKFFIKNSTQTYFQMTVPRHLHTYNIHPEFDSEYQKCWH